MRVGTSDAESASGARRATPLVQTGDAEGDRGSGPDAGPPKRARVSADVVVSVVDVPSVASVNGLPQPSVCDDLYRGPSLRYPIAQQQSLLLIAECTYVPFPLSGVGHHASLHAFRKLVTRHQLRLDRSSPTLKTE